MCGIIGIYSKKNAQEKTLAGLLALSYRGYDSAGIASVFNGEIQRIRSVGKVEILEKKYANFKIFGNVCIGHTRWATHGKPCEENAHPIISGNVAVVHNGIIENYAELKKRLQDTGNVFETETDTEIAAVLVNENLKNGDNPITAVRKILDIIVGSFAFGFEFKGYNDLMIAVKRWNPLIVGRGNESCGICSDIIGLSGICDEIAYLDENEILVIENGEIKVLDKNGNPVEKKFEKLKINPAELEKGIYETFMMKEIHEQPAVISKTLLANENIDFENVHSLNILACGTSFHAGLVGKYWFEKFRKLKTNVEVASEFAYREPCILEDDKFMVISQSGETSDIMAAVKNIKGIHTIYSIVNVKNSAIDKSSDIKFYTEAGVEVGVASTKAFTSQLTVLAKLAFKNNPDLLCYLETIPTLVEETMNVEASIKRISQTLKDYKNVLFIGRDSMYPIAMEGALKLKELSYIHAEAFAGGELKHGPIALIDPNVAMVVLAPSGKLFDKSRSNIQESLARNGKVIAITDEEGASKLSAGVEKIIVPSVDENFAPFIYTIPLQFLAYHVSKTLDRDIDKPRNLAKAVTVE